MVALTGYGQERDKLLSAEAGFAQHLTKTVALDDLERAIFTELPAVQ